MTLLLTLLMLQDSESALRERFTKDFKDKNPDRRVEALKTLDAVTEAKSVALLVGSLRDPAPAVRKAAAETLGTAADPAASGIRPLCGILSSPKEDSGVRLAAARALARVPFRAEAIDAMVQTITGIKEGETALYAFGAEVTQILNGVAGQDFGAGKETPAKWKAWWKENQPKVVKEDGEKRAARLKAK